VLAHSQNLSDAAVFLLFGVETAKDEGRSIIAKTDDRTLEGLSFHIQYAVPAGNCKIRLYSLQTNYPVSYFDHLHGLGHLARITEIDFDHLNPSGIVDLYRSLGSSPQIGIKFTTSKNFCTSLLPRSKEPLLSTRRAVWKAHTNAEYAGDAHDRASFFLEYAGPEKGQRTELRSFALNYRAKLRQDFETLFQDLEAKQEFVRFPELCPRVLSAHWPGSKFSRSMNDGLIIFPDQSSSGPVETRMIAERVLRAARFIATKFQCGLSTDASKPY
jgi:hypothetical protein